MKPEPQIGQFVGWQCDSLLLMRVIWDDILRLKALSQAVKITCAILGILLIIVGYWLGKDWWLATITLHGNGIHRETTRLSLAGVLLTISFICYIASVIERARRQPLD